MFKQALRRQLDRKLASCGRDGGNAVFGVVSDRLRIQSGTAQRNCREVEIECATYLTFAG